MSTLVHPMKGWWRSIWTLVPAITTSRKFDEPSVIQLPSSGLTRSRISIYLRFKKKKVDNLTYMKCFLFIISPIECSMPMNLGPKNRKQMNSSIILTALSWKASDEGISKYPHGLKIPRSLRGLQFQPRPSLQSILELFLLQGRSRALKSVKLVKLKIDNRVKSPVTIITVRAAQRFLTNFGPTSFLHLDSRSLVRQSFHPYQVIPMLQSLCELRQVPTHLRTIDAMLSFHTSYDEGDSPLVMITMEDIHLQPSRCHHSDLSRHSLEKSPDPPRAFLLEEITKKAPTASGLSKCIGQDNKTRFIVYSEASRRLEKSGSAFPDIQGKTLALRGSAISLWRSFPALYR
ncbi:unnamed protein product, partial [Nesidiocoris tenuis]